GLVGRAAARVQYSTGEQRELQDVATVQRQLVDARTVHDGPDLGRLSIHERVLAGHHDLLLRGTDLEREIQGNTVVYPHHQAALVVTAEAWLLSHNLISADHHSREQEITEFVCDCFTL